MEYRTIAKKYINVMPTEDVNMLKVELYYSKGGLNYFTYKEEKRGFYISISPIEKKGNTEIYTAFSGYKRLIQPASRFSAKTGKSLWEDATTIQLIDELVQIVADRNGLTIEG